VTIVNYIRNTLQSFAVPVEAVTRRMVIGCTKNVFRTVLQDDRSKPFLYRTMTVPDLAEKARTPAKAVSVSNSNEEN
jgi:hypothetical protein